MEIGRAFVEGIQTWGGVRRGPERHQAEEKRVWIHTNWVGILVWSQD